MIEDYLGRRGKKGKELKEKKSGKQRSITMRYNDCEDSARGACPGGPFLADCAAAVVPSKYHCLFHVLGATGL